MPDFPRILVIAPHGSYRTSAFITAAHRLGVKVLLVSEGKHSIVSDYAQGLHIDPTDEAAALALILAEAANEPVAAIVATDDSTTELAAKAARQLELPHNPPTAVKLARRKDKARAWSRRMKNGSITDRASRLARVEDAFNLGGKTNGRKLEGKD